MSTPPASPGGMRQRAALLRTAVTGRDLWLLDEPFGSLDALTREQMQDWLLSIRDRLGHTIGLITHSIDEAIYLSDRIYVLTPRPARVKEIVTVDLPAPAPAGWSPRNPSSGAKSGCGVCCTRRKRRSAGDASARDRTPLSKPESPLRLFSFAPFP